MFLFLFVNGSWVVFGCLFILFVYKFSYHVQLFTRKCDVRQQLMNAQEQYYWKNELKKTKILKLCLSYTIIQHMRFNNGHL